VTQEPLNPPPDVVFLDVGDTLVRAHPSWAAVYLSVLEEFGIRVDEPTLRRALDDTFGAGGDYVDGPFDATREASYQRLKAFDTRVLAAFGQPEPPDEFFRSLEAAFAERSAWWVFEDVPPALDALTNAGHRLAVISNWSWSAPELLHTLELARHFEALVISDRVGYLKPHRLIFEHALEIMGVPAERTVHVGDSVRADVHGAMAAGIPAVLIDRATHAHGDDHRTAPPAEVPVIDDLFGLLDLLGVTRPDRVGVP
jgi:putative hydrolase of the HAD superfamily